MIVICAVPALAEVKSTTVKYSVAPSYYVTIDGTATLNKTCSVKLENVVVEEGKQVVVRIASNQSFKLSNGKTGTVDYKVKVGTVEKGRGDEILAVNPSTASSGSATVSFECATSKPKYSGDYSGTIVFVVGVESAS